MTLSYMLHAPSLDATLTLGSGMENAGTRTCQFPVIKLGEDLVKLLFCLFRLRIE